MRDLVIRRYYSRAFGHEFAVVSMSLLVEHGLDYIIDDPASTIYPQHEPDAFVPAKVMRFATREQAVHYVESLNG